MMLMMGKKEGTNQTPNVDAGAPAER
jgi:hypothetical protein